MSDPHYCQCGREIPIGETPVVWKEVCDRCRASRNGFSRLIMWLWRQRLTFLVAMTLLGTLGLLLYVIVAKPSRLGLESRAHSVAVVKPLPAGHFVKSPVDDKGTVAPTPQHSDREQRSQTTVSNTVKTQTDKLALFKECLATSSWTYHDPGWPDSIVRFYQDGTFHDRWKWNYWIVDERSIHVQFWEKQYDPARAVLFEFSNDLSKFTGEFTDEKGRLHQVTGSRQDAATMAGHGEQRSPDVTAVSGSKEEIEEFKSKLLSGVWRYRDVGWPDSTVRFYDDGTFHDHWKWNYWIVGPRTIHVQFWEKKYNPAGAVVFEFGDDITAFSASFVDDRRRSHSISGTLLSREGQQVPADDSVP